jgi:hypothetical protein
MRLLLAGILALLPLSAWADTLSTVKADTLDPQAIADPVDPNEAKNADETYDTLDQLWPYGNPYSPASPTNFEALTPSPQYDQGRLSPRSYEPEWLNDPFGRYGSPYSPDPMNQRYDVGNLYSPGSPMNLYTRGGRTERR